MDEKLIIKYQRQEKSPIDKIIKQRTKNQKGKRKTNQEISHPKSGKEAESFEEVASCLLFPRTEDQSDRRTEKAERAVKASQRRRAPNPGGAVQRKRNLLRNPM